MIIPTWLPFAICFTLCVILAIAVYIRPYRSSNKYWCWINKHIIGVVGAIFFVPIFIPIIISWTAPRIWIVRSRDAQDERLIIFSYHGKSGFGNRFVENATDNTLVAARVFYGKPKPGQEHQDEYYSVAPKDIIKIKGEPYFRYPSQIIIDRHYGAPHKYGKYQWFVFEQKNNYQLLNQ